MACPGATASSGTDVDGMVACPELLASMLDSVVTAEPGAAHDPFTIATEWDEFASNPVRVPVSVEFAPATLVMVTVPEGPKAPVALTCTLCGAGVGAVESEQAAIAHAIVTVLKAVRKRFMIVLRSRFAKETFFRREIMTNSAHFAYRSAPL